MSLSTGDLCMDEMSTLMACWRDHEFAVDKCAKEIAKFQNCVTMAAVSLYVQSVINLL